MQPTTRLIHLPGSPADGEIDHWFEFGPASYEPTIAIPDPDHFRAIANEVTYQLDTQMETWLGSKEPPN